MSQPNPAFVVTGQVRFSYVHLIRPTAREGQEPRYSVTVLLPKSDTETKARIDAAIAAAAQNGERMWGERPEQLSTPIHDGDGIRPGSGRPFGPECKGHWVFTASCRQDRKPEIVDVNKNPIVDPTQIYSGMYGRVSLHFFPYAQSGKMGVGCGLNNVQKLAEGEALGIRTTAAQDFDAMPENGRGQPPLPVARGEAAGYMPPSGKRAPAQSKAAGN